MSDLGDNDQPEATSALQPELGYAELESSLAAFADLHFRITADGTYVRVWAADPDDLIVPAAEIPGTHVGDHFPPSLTKRMLDAITATIATSKVTAVQYSLGEGDETQHFEARMAPLGEDEVMAVVRDISRLKELEQHLVHAETMQSIGRLAGGIAHDFNNVLHVIRGHAAALQRNPEDTEQTDRRLGAITRAVDRTSSLIERLMILSRPSVNNPTPSHVDSFLRGLGPTLSQLLGETIELEFALGGGDSAVVIDDSRFENVLLNLATNALDAMPEGGALRISTEVRHDELIVLQISDTGAGIDPDAIPHVFDPFFTTKGSGIGTGLGLATTYTSVTAAGGSITVDSVLGSGTTFTIVFPTTNDSPEQVDVAERVEAGGINATVLVVEDEPDVLELCGDALREMGFRVLEARGSLDALELMEDGPAIDLLLTDVVMPSMSGPELVAEIEERHGGLAVVYMSGYAEDTVVNGKGLSAADILRKPFTERQLREVIDAQLGRRTAESDQTSSAKPESEGFR